MDLLWVPSMVAAKVVVTVDLMDHSRVVAWDVQKDTQMVAPMVAYSDIMSVSRLVGMRGDTTERGLAVTMVA